MEKNSLQSKNANASPRKTNVDNITTFVTRTQSSFNTIIEGSNADSLLSIELNDKDLSLRDFHNRNNSTKLHVASSDDDGTNRLLDMLKQSSQNNQRSRNYQVCKSTSCRHIDSFNKNICQPIASMPDCDVSIKCTTLSSQQTTTDEVQTIFNVDSKDKNAANCDDIVRSKSDSGMKEFAMKQSAFDLSNKRCNQNTCKFGGYCIGKITMAQLSELRTKLWNNKDSEAPSTSERYSRLETSLKKLYHETDGKFSYKVGGNEICEQAWLTLLAVITHKETSRASKQYNNAKRAVQGIKQTNSNVRVKNKEEHARAWLEYVGDLFADVGYGENNTNKRYVPYDTFAELYEEYEHYHRLDNSDIREETEKVTCSKETFRKAFHSLKETIKLRTAKGSFETCCVCNNLNDCLKNTSGDWSSAQLDLILRLKRLHLLQQATERLDSNRRKMEAIQSKDKSGNPTSAYLEIDGFTEFKTKSPIQSGGRKSKGDTKKIGNRVVGVVVACGPVQTRFVYSLNDLVRGGANIMIEVVRQSLYDLGKILASHALALPKQLCLQFDNCGENKNKYMFAYLSLLVEQFYFDIVYVNFLIVGHTHTTIDQYFSVLTKKICSKKFIGSPLALRALFQECQNPMSNRSIDYYFDYKTWLTPVLNHNLKNYQLPHCFKIRRVFSKAVCTHKPYSSSPEWLPPEPKNRTSEEQLCDASVGITLSEFDLYGSIEAVANAVVNDGRSISETDLILNPACDGIAERGNVFRQLRNKIQLININTICESIGQIDLEADKGYISRYDPSLILLKETANGFESPNGNQNSSGDDNIDVSDICVSGELPGDSRCIVQHEQRQTIQKMMASHATIKEGYVFWLDYSKIDHAWEQTTPKPINYYTESEMQAFLPVRARDDCSDDDEVEQGNQQGLIGKLIERSSAHNLKSQLNIMVTAAKDVLKKVADKVFRTHPDVAKVCDFGPEKQLSQLEIAFYEANRTIKRILTNLKTKIDEAGPFKLFLDSMLSEQQKSDIATKKRQREEQNQQASARLMSLMGSRANNSYLTSADPSSSNVMTHQAGRSGKTGKKKELISKRHKKVQFCEVLDCGAEKEYKCAKKNCGKLVCKLHGKAHEKHATVTSWKPSVSAPSKSIAINAMVESDAATVTCHILECMEKALFVCTDSSCGIQVCVLHGAEHSKHSAQLLKNNK